MSKSVWLICPAYWQDHNRHLKINFFFTQTERKKGYRVLDPPLLPPHSYSTTVAPPPPLFAGKPVKMEKPEKTEFRRFSSNMQQVTYHFQYFGHSELIFDVRFVKLSSLPSQKLLK